MPNFFSAFTSDVFRPLVTLIIPGAIGISTWFIGFLWHFPLLRALVHNNHTEVGFVLLLAMIFAGMFFEDMGSHIETQLDEWRDSQDGEHLKTWYAYLRTAFKADPIGRRYVRTLVLRLKFELGVACAMASAAIGLVWLATMGLNCGLFAINELVCVSFAAWGAIEAVGTHKTLAVNRANLLETIRVVDQDKLENAFQA